MHLNQYVIKHFYIYKKNAKFNGRCAAAIVIEVEY